MTSRDFHEAYGTSVYKVRLQVAIGLLAVPGISQKEALEEADKFVLLLLQEEMGELRRKFE
jgi:hypothetical protein